MSSKLDQCPLVIEFPVAWGEMDALQHVNNAVYFRYFESVRMAYFEKAGLNQLMAEENIGPILASTQCRFKAPLTYPDTVSIGTEITDIEETQFLMRYYVLSHKSGRIVAEGDGLTVCYDYNQNCRASIPEKIRRNFDELAKAKG